MEEIIGLLIIVATFIFKAVGKKMEKAGLPAEHSEEPLEQVSAPPVPEYIENVERQVPVRKQVPAKKPKAPRRPVAAKPILNETMERKKEKIDVKKMIIYSEIMSPKCNE